MPTQKVQLVAGKMVDFRVPQAYNNLFFMTGNGVFTLQDARSNLTEKMIRGTGIHYNTLQPRGKIGINGTLTETIHVFYGKDEEVKNGFGVFSIPSVSDIEGIVAGGADATGVKPVIDGMIFQNPGGTPFSRALQTADDQSLLVNSGVAVGGRGEVSFFLPNLTAKTGTPTTIDWGKFTGNGAVMGQLPPSYDVLTLEVGTVPTTAITITGGIETKTTQALRFIAPDGTSSASITTTGIFRVIVSGLLIVEISGGTVGGFGVPYTLVSNGKTPV